uniref:Uncharacterized protein n=1 Tax=Oryza rufipogon TaxID=4529 RepID=A0A0E0Q082_ORYRU
MLKTTIHRDSSSSALVIFSHQVLLRLLRASPPRLQVATFAALGWWSRYLYMATDDVVPAGHAVVCNAIIAAGSDGVARSR